MENFLDVPEEVLESMLIMAREFMGRDEYGEKIADTNWRSPIQAGPAWQELKTCFERITLNAHLPRVRETIEKIIPILQTNGLTLNGSRITRQAG